MSIDEKLANHYAHIDKLYEKLDDLRKRVKALEQKDSYYPTKEEIPYIKVGGTD